MPVPSFDSASQALALQKRAERPATQEQFHIIGVLNKLYVLMVNFFFFKQKTAYEMTCDWSSDVCSSDLGLDHEGEEHGGGAGDVHPEALRTRPASVPDRLAALQGLLLPLQDSAAKGRPPPPRGQGHRPRRQRGHQA